MVTISVFSVVTTFCGLCDVPFTLDWSNLFCLMKSLVRRTVSWSSFPALLRTSRTWLNVQTLKKNDAGKH